jgi:hypothetical protein
VYYGRGQNVIPFSKKSVGHSVTWDKIYIASGLQILVVLDRITHTKKLLNMFCCTFWPDIFTIQLVTDTIF